MRATRKQPSPAAAAAPAAPTAAPTGLHDDLVARINELGKQDFTIWISYLSLLVFLGVTVLTTTHAELLANTSKRLPVIGVELPLKGFFVLAPIVFLAAYIFMLLTLKARGAEIMLVLQRLPGGERDLLCREMCGAGMAGSTVLDRVRDITARVAAERALRRVCAEHSPGRRFGWGSFRVRLLSVLMFVAAPVTLLVLFLLAFLPYQSEPITLFHYAFVLGALIAACIFLGPQNRMPRMAAFATAACGVAVIALLANVRGSVFDVIGQRPGAFPCALLYDGTTTTEEKRPPCHLFSRVLVLHDEDLLGDRRNLLGRPDAARTVVLRGRNLRGAILVASDLRKADLTGADLRGARLDQAWLEGAYLSGAKLEGATLNGADLRGAQLERVRLVGASLVGTRLSGANLAHAQLQGADMEGADLRGAWLADASMQGAALDRARLDAAFLLRAKLAGTSLRSTDLDAAYVRGANVARSAFTRDQAKLLHGWDDIQFDDAPPAIHGVAVSWQEAIAAWVAMLPDAPARASAVDRLLAIHYAIEISRHRGAAEREGPEESTPWADRLHWIGCDPEDTGFIARGVIRQIWENPSKGADSADYRTLDADQRTLIASRYLYGKACRGSDALDAAARARLYAIVRVAERPGQRGSANTPAAPAPEGARTASGRPSDTAATRPAQ